MCGIVGYIGERSAAKILLEGLSGLEYRGYDSAGMAVLDKGTIQVEKAVGRLENLRNQTQDGSLVIGGIGIGHTRWATHGAPTKENAHPHLNKKKTIAVVHNGIIENYGKLRERMRDRGYEFVSETDTEVLAHMLDYYYKEDPIEAITKVLHRVEGSYALGIIFADKPDHLYAARKDSPLIAGICEDGYVIASDVPAILPYSRDIYYLEDLEIACLTKKEIHFYNNDKEEVKKESKEIHWNVKDAQKDGYETFMLKEIYDQPKAVMDTFKPRIRDKRIEIDELNLSNEQIRQIRKIHIVACGSAYHAGVTGKYVLEGLARVPVEAELASEFRYRNPILEPGTLVVVISQSGETADTLAAIREAKSKRALVLAIVNVVGSSIAREADYVLYTWAGPEISVATTKAYSAQLMALYLLAVRFAYVRGAVSGDVMREMIGDLEKLPSQIETLLEQKEKMQRFANRYLGAESVFFIGRGLDYATALEGSLKLKEISYIHSEAYAAGELKHGTISLIEEGTLVTAIATQPDLHKKMVSNIVEVKSRGAFVMAVASEEFQDIEGSADYVIWLPKTNPWFTNSLAIIPLQLFAYYVSLGRGLDVDKPRNLAKSVTVE